jgi:hypothetical protein
MGIEIESRRAKRIRKIMMGAAARYICVPLLFSSGLWIIAIGLLVRAFRPRLDLNSWPLFIRIFPIWVVLLGLTLYVLSAIQVRLLIHRKGASRAIGYIFPEALSGKESRIDRFSYQVLGIRSLIRKVREDSR